MNRNSVVKPSSKALLVRSAADGTTLPYYCGLPGLLSLQLQRRIPHERRAKSRKAISFTTNHDSLLRVLFLLLIKTLSSSTCCCTRWLQASNGRCWACWFNACWFKAAWWAIVTCWTWCFEASRIWYACSCLWSLRTSCSAYSTRGFTVCFCLGNTWWCCVCCGICCFARRRGCWGCRWGYCFGVRCNRRSRCLAWWEGRGSSPWLLQYCTSDRMWDGWHC